MEDQQVTHPPLGKDNLVQKVAPLQMDVPGKIDQGMKAGLAPKAAGLNTVIVLHVQMAQGHKMVTALPVQTVEDLNMAIALHVQMAQGHNMVTAHHVQMVEDLNMAIALHVQMAQDHNMVTALVQMVQDLNMATVLLVQTVEGLNMVTVLRVQMAQGLNMVTGLRVQMAQGLSMVTALLVQTVQDHNMVIALRVQMAQDHNMVTALVQMEQDLPMVAHAQMDVPVAQGLQWPVVAEAQPQAARQDLAHLVVAQAQASLTPKRANQPRMIENHNGVVAHKPAAPKEIKTNAAKKAEYKAKAVVVAASIVGQNQP